MAKVETLGDARRAGKRTPSIAELLGRERWQAIVDSEQAFNDLCRKLGADPEDDTSLWALARHDLHLSDSDFWDMTPREFFALMKRQEVTAEREALLRTALQTVAEHAKRRERKKRTPERDKDRVHNDQIKRRIVELYDYGKVPREIVVILDAEPIPLPVTKSGWENHCNKSWQRAYKSPNPRYKSAARKFITDCKPKTRITADWP